MSTMFLTLRYLAFALFILFNSVICIVSALNLGSLSSDTQSFPEVDSYLIFTGALGLVVVFPVIFIELIRKDAYLARVAFEVAWVGLLWLMNLSGAAAITSIASQIHCLPTGDQLPVSCSSTTAMLAFTWLSTITLLSYLLCLVVCAVYHSQDNSHVWHSGVRDFHWFSQPKSSQNPPDAAFTYGKLMDPRDPNLPPIYARQMGLAKNYTVEPLSFTSTTVQLANPTRAEYPVPPVPAAPSDIRNMSQRIDDYRVTYPSPLPPSSQYSLYPQHLQSAVTPAIPPRAGGPTPPPAGSWPRTKPQEPIRKQRLSQSSNKRTEPSTLTRGPEMVRQNTQEDPSLPSNARSRPSGPRILSQRPRPPPLDLSRLNSQRS